MNERIKRDGGWWSRIVPPGSIEGPLAAVAANIIIVYVAYSLCRIEFLLENYSSFSEAISEGRIWGLLGAGIVFDTPGIFYINALFILLMLLPIRAKECKGWYRICKWVFILANGMAILANIADSVYFQYTLRRTDISVLSEFSNETNIIKIAGVEVLRHWYLLLFYIILLWGIWKGFRSPVPVAKMVGAFPYYIGMSLTLVAAAVISVAAIRGGWLNHWYCYILAAPIAYLAWRMFHINHRRIGIICAIVATAILGIAPIGGWRHRDIRPIAISNANAYTRHPVETALVLNTPFSLIRSIGNSPFKETTYFSDETALANFYTPVHTPDARATLKAPGKNLVVIIVESLGKEYVGGMNKEILGADYKGFTPFVDSLLNHSAWWTHSLGNGRKSIDGIPSVLASIPMFVRPYVLTPQSVNNVKGIPALLGEMGYHTAFFHGARTGSMGFNGIAASVGFEKYYGREDFCADSRTKGDKEFDGYWAIWDEPFLVWYAQMMSDMHQPFMTALFTASNHHPFRIPSEYKGKFQAGSLPIHLTCGYTDNALRQFFAVAKQQPWYKNTIFIITNDHTNMSAHDEYRSDIGSYFGPLIIFDPSGGITPGERNGIIQQIDILPTMVNYLGYDRPYVAFGCDVFRTPEKQQWAVNYINGVYQYVKHGYILQFDGTRAIAVYRIDDYLMRHNLIGTTPYEKEMTLEVKAIIQQYMHRMLTDRLIAR